MKKPSEQQRRWANRRLMRFGFSLKEQGIGFYVESIQQPGALHDLESKDAGNLLYYVNLESSTSQCSDQYGHTALWENYELMMLVTPNRTDL